jgi:hypothetical protein
MEVRCRKGDCSFNTGCSCKAKGITIERESTACDTYDKDPIKKSLIIENGNIFEVTDKEVVAKNMRNVPLACEAKSCLYNKNAKCCANGITVIDGNNTETGREDAECATFVEGMKPATGPAAMKTKATAMRKKRK